MDETLTGATTQGQSRSESNGNKRVLHTLDLQNLNCTIRCSLVPYPGHPYFWRWGSYPSAVYTASIF